MENTSFSLSEQEIAEVRVLTMCECVNLPFNYTLNHMVSPAGKYLSYKKWGRDSSGRVRLQSADKERPMRWRVLNKESNTFSLEAVRPFFS